MFNSPRLILLLVSSVCAVVLILIRLLWLTVWMLMLVGDGSTGSVERCVRLQICVLAWNLVCQVILHLIKLAKLLQITGEPFWVGWTPSLQIRAGFPQKLSTMKRWHETKHLIASQIGKGTREYYDVWHRFYMVTHQLSMKFGDLRLTKPGVIYYYYKKNLGVLYYSTVPDDWLGIGVFPLILFLKFIWLLRTCLTLWKYLALADFLSASSRFSFACEIPRYL